MARKKELDKLSRDAAAARAAGMTYGKWKALQPAQPATASEEVRPTGKYEFTCAFCGKKFYRSDRTPRKYCSDDCRDSGYRATKSEREKAQRRMKHDNCTASQCPATHGAGD